MEKNTWMWIIGILFISVTADDIASLVVQRRRCPLEDEEVDRRITRDFKDGLVSPGIFFGIIASVFLLVLGLYALIR